MRLKGQTSNKFRHDLFGGGAGLFGFPLHVLTTHVDEILGGSREILEPGMLSKTSRGLTLCTFAQSAAM